MNEKHKLTIDAATEIQRLLPIWRSFGYDEINWTYTPRGRYAFKQIGALSDQSYYIRCHHTFTGGNGLSVPTKGSTNICTKLSGSEPQLDFTILDEVLDTIIESNCKPIVELGFMPDILSSGPAPKPAYNYEGNDLWMYPPNDYGKWQRLIHLVVKHCLERYGAEEVGDWYWELWNEPDNAGFFRGTIKDYCKMYDFAVAGATDALPTIKIGGPGLAANAKFLEKFLKHCSNGKNRAMGGRGTRLDFISFHAKGTDWPLKGQPFKMPSLAKIMGHLEDYVRIIRQFPEFETTPCLLDECDMAVATNFGMFDFAEYEMNNTAYFPVFVARMAKAIWDFSHSQARPIQFFTTWAFYFEGKRFFEGNRALFTNADLKKPLYNVFSLFEQIGHRRLKFDIDKKKQIDGIDGLATLSKKDRLSVVLWNFKEGSIQPTRAAAGIRCEIRNLTLDSTRPKAKIIRIDESHSNAYSAWQKMGSPQNPSDAQLDTLKQVDGLEEGEELTINCEDSRIVFETELPPQSLALVLMNC